MRVDGSRVSDEIAAAADHAMVGEFTFDALLSAVRAAGAPDEYGKNGRMISYAIARNAIANHRRKGLIRSDGRRWRRIA